MFPRGVAGGQVERREPRLKTVSLRPWLERNSCVLREPRGALGIPLATSVEERVAKDLGTRHPIGCPGWILK